jgi:hypothetical protein
MPIEEALVVALYVSHEIIGIIRLPHAYGTILRRCVKRRLGVAGEGEWGFFWGGHGSLRRTLAWCNRC